MTKEPKLKIQNIHQIYFCQQKNVTIICTTKINILIYKYKYLCSDYECLIKVTLCRFPFKHVYKLDFRTALILVVAVL